MLFLSYLHSLTIMLNFLLEKTLKSIMFESLRNVDDKSCKSYWKTNIKEFDWKKRKEMTFYINNTNNTKFNIISTEVLSCEKSCHICSLKISWEFHKSILIVRLCIGRGKVGTVNKVIFIPCNFYLFSLPNGFAPS